MASLASCPSVPRRVCCRAAVALGLRWLTAMAQLLCTHSILAGASATQVGVFLAWPPLYLWELQYSSATQQPDSIQQLLWRKGSLRQDMSVFGSCPVTSDTPRPFPYIVPSRWGRAEHVGAACTLLTTHRHESGYVPSSRGSRPHIQSTSRLLFWKSPLGKHPPACQELPAAPPAGAGCRVVWLGSGRACLCLLSERLKGRILSLYGENHPPRAEGQSQGSEHILPE